MLQISPGSGFKNKSEMDEVNQPTGSDTVSKDSLIGDSEASVGECDGQEGEETLPKKINCDTSSSSILIDALNTNGVDKDTESNSSELFHTSDVLYPECIKEKTHDSVGCKSISELNVTDKNVVDSLEECVGKHLDGEILSSSVDSGNINFKLENSNRSENLIKKKEDFFANEKKNCVLGSQVVESDRDSSLPECGNYESAKCENKENVIICEESPREDISVKKNEMFSPLEKKNSEITSENSLEECLNNDEAIGSSEQLETTVEIDSSLKKPNAEIEPLQEVENESNLHEFHSDLENCSVKANLSVNEISQIKEIDKFNQKSILPNEDVDEELVICEKKFEEESDINDTVKMSDQQNKEQEKNSERPITLSEDLIKENENIEKSSCKFTELGDQKNKEAEDSSKLLDEELSKAEVISKETETTKNSNIEVATLTPEIQDLPDFEFQEKSNKENNSDVFLLDGNPSCEVIDNQVEKKSDYGIDSENELSLFKTDSDESKSENPNLESKTDSIQEWNQNINPFSSSNEIEEENVNKSTNEGNEIMDTEMINCNEIEQVDVSENETDMKSESRDEEMAGDSLETPIEKTNEDELGDSKEFKEALKNEVDEEAVNRPGNSEEETITGDTTIQSSTVVTKEKDEEVCIIPDDVIPGLSILPENKEVSNNEIESEGVKEFKESQPELEKPKTRAHDKKIQGVDPKSRPVRNAAKLAGNKIKSLVENDLVFEEHSSSSGLEGEMEIQENVGETTQMCAQCREVKICKLLSVQNDSTHYFCSEKCLAAFKTLQVNAELTETVNFVREHVRKCSQCHAQINVPENLLFWETMDFCNEDCLGKYQLELGSNCANCKKSVPHASLGKYCVRFGYDIKQFCSAICLEEYKKGLKVCSYCQKDISTGVEGFLAPVGTKGQFKDFCTQSCMEKYDRMSSNKPSPDIIEECAVCSNSKPVRVEVELDNKTHRLCSEPCFAAFKFVNNITEGQCDMCRKYFDRSKIPKFSLRLLFYDETLHSFCSKTCMNVYILANRKIVPCNWCKVKKYNFDMIRNVSADGQLIMMCSLHCLLLHKASLNAASSRPYKCDFCTNRFHRQPLYHLAMSDATLRRFCSYNCVMSFQKEYQKQKMDVIPGADQLGSPIPTGGPKRLVPKRPQVESTCVPVISSVQSLASPNGPVSPTGRVTIARGDVNLVPQGSQTLQTSVAPIPAPSPQVYQQIITKPAPVKQMKNKSVLCKPYSHTKGVSCRPHPCMKETQTDQSLNRKFLIPIPVPIYVPAPMHMFSAPFPVPVPFPLPIPVPIFIPTTRNSAKGIMKEIKKIQEKIPTDPFEAELLMMAEMVAGEKKQDPTDSESEDGNDGDDNGDGTFSPENVDTSNTFGDDMLQMALKMATELEEPAVDMESVLTSNTITTSTQPAVDPNKTLYASDTDDPDQVNVMAMNRGRKRSVRGSRNSAGGTPSKRGRRTSGSVDVPLLPPPEPVPPRTIEVEKPDANMCLKYTFGVNAWRHWVMQKNAELEKAALTNRKIKLFKPELLQLTADELNFSLCLFVKEVRKPNGTEYAPDTIYYLCLGIQQYLFENGRIDNIFTDSYYEKFTDCLDEVAKKFAALYNDSQYIVTRVEEEHLWESKQLGAHSPHVLLSTLMFFNTKHFNLVTVEEHMQLSFSHIMKHWKRNPNTPGVAKVPGSRNVLLRFYPPQSALEANARKKKVYEQQENEENPLRCPVKLYEFYLSKCPESVKTRNDVFYLLPERSCVPDSPVWYSTMALGKDPLMKMLHRIKMVKEINIALLTS